MLQYTDLTLGRQKFGGQYLISFYFLESRTENIPI